VTIRLERVRKSYREVEVVRDLDLEIAEGEFFTLLGASGSGKTTTLRLIAGFEAPDGGRIQLGAVVVSDSATGLLVPPERRGLGMVFQSYALWPHLTVRGNLGLGLQELRVAPAEIARRIATVLEQVGLAGLEHRYPNELSGGQQQRIALARALIMEPRILLLDEPLSNVDSTLREQVRNDIRALQRRLGITTVLVTHDQVEAMSVSDRIGIMHLGRVVQVDRPETLYHRPRSTFAATFLGQANLLRGNAAGGVARVADATLKLVVPVVNGPVTLMLRPESVVFSDGPNSFAAEVQSATLMGSLTRYDVGVPALGRGLRIEESSAAPTRQGAVTISLPPERIVPIPD
jgi:putative spermidine/putrescine transport system ATP-binding protein